MNGTKSFVKSTAVYFFGSILSKLIVFFLLPIYTTYISPEHYGYYDLVVNYITFFSTILFLNVWTGIIRFMFDSTERLDKLKAVYSSLSIYGLSLLLYIVMFSILNAVIHIQYFPLVLLYGFFLTLQNLYGNIARGFGESVLFAVGGILCTLFTMLLNIILVVWLKQSYWSLYVASSAGILVQILMLEINMKLIPNFSVQLIDKQLTKQLFIYSLPLCLNSVAYWFLTSFNRVVIVSVLGETQNGYFAIASKFSVAINLIGSCFSLAWQETVFKKEGEHEVNSDYYSKASDLYIKFLWMGTICLLPVINIAFPFLINSTYNSAKLLVPLSLLGTSVSLYSSFIGSIFGAIKQNRTVFISTLLASIANIAVIYLTIFRIGVQAANLSFLIGFTVNSIVRIHMLRQKIDFHVALKPFIFYIPLFAIVTYIYLAQGRLANAFTLLLTGCILLLVLRKPIVAIWNGLLPKRQFHPQKEPAMNQISLQDLKKIEYDLLLEFSDFCDEHHLRYFLAYGTLLGAVKYHGFIPWDDDMDINMPRPDYDRFLELTAGKLGEDAAVLSQNTPGYIYPFAKIINSKTVLMEDIIDMSHPLGVYIDVFPIDGLPRDEKQIRRLSKKQILIKKMLFLSVSPIKKGKTPGSILLKALVFTPFKIIGYRFFTKKLDSLAREWNFETSEYVSRVAWDRKIITIDKENYIKPVMLKFENRLFKAPSNYHEHLTALYGDYSKLPPADKCVSHHHFQAYWREEYTKEAVETCEKKDAAEEICI